MTNHNMIRWLFVGTSSTPVSTYIEEFGKGKPVFSTVMDDSYIQISLDQILIEPDASIEPLSKWLDTHIIDLLVIVTNSDVKASMPLLESLLSMANLPQSCFLCDTNSADKYCTALEGLVTAYSSPGYSFHYMNLPVKGIEVLRECLLRATRYCLRRREIMLSHCQSQTDTQSYASTDPIRTKQAETSSPLVSLSPQVPQITNARRLQGEAIDSTPNISPTKLMKDDSKKPISLPMNIGTGKEAMFHGYAGQDPGSAVLQFMKENGVSSRDYVEIYNKVKQLMIDNGYLSDDERAPADTANNPQERRTDSRLIFSTNILFGSKKIKIDFYENDTSEEVARRTAKSLGLGQNYEAFLRKKIDTLCSTMQQRAASNV